MATSESWNLSVVDGLRAHFKQAQGPSRAGTDWAVSLANSGGERLVLVRVYADDIVVSSQEQEAQQVLNYVAGLLKLGWSPEQYRGEPGELTLAPQKLTLAPQNMSVADVQPASRPWWRFW